MIRTRLHGPMLKRRIEQRKAHRASMDARTLGVRDGRQDGLKEAREEYRRQRVMFIEAPRDGRFGRTLVIGQEPERELVEVMFTPGGSEQFDRYGDHRGIPPSWALMQVPDIVRFRAKRESWQAGTGQVVTWWTWEPLR